MLNSKVKQFVPKPQKVKVPKTHQAKVTRVDSSGVVWVAIDGGAPETPCLTSSVATKPGDRVTVQIQDHRAAVTGNLSSPATDDALATKAQKNAVNALDKAEGAEEVARRAKRYADDAMNEAVEARELVDGVVTDVNTAVANAQTAYDKAVEVNTLANTANSTANQASSNAASALGVANTANDIATGAIARSVAAESAINSLNVRTRDGNGESLVRAYSGGVLTGRVGQEYCALVNAGDEETEPSFDIVRTTWEEGEGTNTIFEFNPDTGEYEETQETVTKAIPVIRDVYASFGKTTTIGNAKRQFLSIDDDSFAIYEGEYYYPDSEVPDYLRNRCFIGKLNDSDGLYHAIDWTDYGSGGGLIYVSTQHSIDMNHPVTIKRARWTGSYNLSFNTQGLEYGGRQYQITTLITIDDPQTADANGIVISQSTYGYQIGVPPYVLNGDLDGRTDMLIVEYETDDIIYSYSLCERVSGHGEGPYSFCEGVRNSAAGRAAHAEGGGNVADAGYAHAEGLCNYSMGMYSHVEGSYNFVASGCAHVEGSHNISALSSYQHVEGMYNDPNNDAAFVIGNGKSESERSNAMTVDWNGNAAISGDLSYSNGSEIVSLRAQIAALKAEIQTLRDSVSQMMSVTGDVKSVSVNAYGDNPRTVQVITILNNGDRFDRYYRANGVVDTYFNIGGVVKTYSFDPSRTN